MGIKGAVFPVFGVSLMVSLALAPLPSLVLLVHLLTAPSLAWHQEGHLGELLGQLTENCN